MAREGTDFNPGDGVFHGDVDGERHSSVLVGVERT